MVKVLHMTKLGAGGISTLTININKCIDLQKVKFDYLVFENEKTFYEDMVKELGGEKRIVDVQKYSNNKFLLYWKKYKGVKRLLHSYYYDVVHVDASTPLDVVIGLAAKHSGVKTIVLHSHIAGDTKKSRVRTIYMNICRSLMKSSFTHYFAISDSSAKFMFPKTVYSNKNYSIYRNGIIADKYIPDSMKRDEIRRKLGIEDKFVVGHIGRFSNEKNHEFLMNVFAEIAKQNSRAVLLLIGTGPLVDTIKEKCKKLKIYEKVIFYGTTYEVPSLLDAMDVFVFPSKFEGLGIAAIESQCSGLPTFVSEGVPNEADISDLFIRINGFYPDEWAKKIIEYDYEQKRKGRVIEVKNAGFDIKMVAEKLEAFYVQSCK